MRGCRAIEACATDPGRGGRKEETQGEGGWNND